MRAHGSTFFETRVLDELHRFIGHFVNKILELSLLDEAFWVWLQVPGSLVESRRPVS